MSVSIVTDEPFPNGMAATNRIKCIAKAFLMQGIDCKVILFSYNSSIENITSSGTYEGIPYEYVGDYANRYSGMLLRKMYAFILRIRLLIVLNNQLRNNDIVYGYLSGKNRFRTKIIRLIHKKGAYYISELCEYPFGPGKETRKKVKRRNYELNRLFPLFDGVVAISDALIQLAKNYCSTKCVIVKIPILVDFAKYDLPDNSDLASKQYIFHSGTLTEQKDGILGMIESFGLAVKKLSLPIHYVITGSVEQSQYNQEIKFLIEKYNLKERIHFIGYKTYDGLKKPLSEASLVILNKYPTQQNYYGFSTKLGEYLAAGKPIIITRVGEAMNWLTDKENAYIVEPNDIGKMADAIVYAFEHENERKRIGQNAKAVCKISFDYHIYGMTLEKMISRMISR